MMSDGVGSGRNSSNFYDPAREYDKINLDSQLKPPAYQPPKAGDSIKIKTIPYNPNLLPEYNRGLQQQPQIVQQPQQNVQQPLQNVFQQQQNGNQNNGNQQNLGHQQQDRLQQAANVIKREGQLDVPSGGFSENQIYQPQPSQQFSGLSKTVIRQQVKKRLISQKQILIELFLCILEVKQKYNIPFEDAKRNQEILSLIYAIECYKIKKQWLTKEQKEVIRKEEKQFFQFWKIEKEASYFRQMYNFFFDEQNEYDLEQNLLIDTTFGDKILNWQLSDLEVDSTFCITQLGYFLQENHVQYVKYNLPPTIDTDYEQKIRGILQYLQINLLQLLCILHALNQNHHYYELKQVQQMMGEDTIFKNIK